MDGMGWMMDGRTDASLQAYKQPNLTGHMQALRRHGSMLHPLRAASIGSIGSIGWTDGTHCPLTGKEGRLTCVESFLFNFGYHNYCTKTVLHLLRTGVTFTY